MTTDIVRVRDAGVLSAFDDPVGGTGSPCCSEKDGHVTFA